VALCCVSLADATQDAGTLFGGAHHAYSLAHARFLARHDLPHHADQGRADRA
jgi:hypothetical protein